MRPTLPFRPRTKRGGSLPFRLSALALLAIAACGGGGGGGSTSPGSQTLSAAFTIATTSGARPLDVAFTNQSTGATSYAWDFGDGGTSSVVSPVHRYEEPGAYTVRLTANGPTGSDEFVATNAVRVFAPLVDAGFEAQTAGSAPSTPWEAFHGAGSATGVVVRDVGQGAEGPMPTEGVQWCSIGADSTVGTLPPPEGDGATARMGAGVAVEFTFPEGHSVLQLDAQFLVAEAYGSAARNDWMSIDVSDGSTSKNLYRRDTFSGTEAPSDLHPGLRRTPRERVTADLTELFLGSNETTAFVLTIQVGNGGDGTQPSVGHVDGVRFTAAGPEVVAEFFATPTSVEVGLPVQFVNQSSGAPTSASWDFGDGSASSQTSPSHVYAAPGLYDVTLRTSNDDAAGERVRADYVQVFAPTGEVDFAGTPIPAATGATVTFTNLSNGPFVEFTWDFGDGATLVQAAGVATAEHAYASPGNYSVRLTGRFANQTTVSTLKTGYAVVQTPAAITTNPTDQTVVVNQPATFTVVATGTALQYEWRRNGSVIPGAPSAPQYQTPPTTPANHGDRYGVRVFNGVSSVLSNSASLNVVSPPVITAPPQPATVSVGTSATFTVVATGFGLAYEWQRNGVAIPGATASSYTTPPTTMADNGAVSRARVSNLAGSTTSNGATLTVIAAPDITVQPQNQSVNAGQPATFTVTATGTGLSYEWQRNGTPIAGAPNLPSYTVTSAQTVDHGASFRVRVFNLGGSVTSNPATLTVFSVPVVTQQPQNVTVNVGSTAQFTVTATGNGLSYEWQRNGAVIPGAGNAPTYTTPATTASDDGATYRVRVFNPAGSTLSASATLTVTSAPVITTEPVDLIAASGSSASFLVVAAGTGLTYQWQVDGPSSGTSYSNIGGATNSMLGVSATTAVSGSRYRCIVTNTAGSDTSYGALLTVVTTPLITTQPSNATVNQNTTASFSVVATGGSLSYEWQRNGTIVAGAPNAATYSFTAGAGDHNAQYRCRVYNVAGSVLSSSATLSVVTPPVITTQPVSQSAFSGQSVTFTVAATSIAAMTYQWEVDLFGGSTSYSNVAGATSATLPLTASTSLSGNSYRCRVTNSAGTTTSNAAVLTVGSQPSVTTDPTNGTVFSGQSARLIVSASGSGLAYQWQSAPASSPTAFANVSGGSGATTSTYTTPALGTAQSGTVYRCRVSNGLGTVDSTTAPITVVATPSIGSDRSTFTGDAVSFSVTPVVSGVSYQWRFDAAGGSSVFVDVGTNSSTYTITNPQTANRGTYLCEVTNSRGTVSSNTCSLFVHQQIPVTTTVDLGSTGTIGVSADGASLSYQWQTAPSGSSTFTNVGTNSSTYSIPTTTTADDGRQFRVRVTNTTGTLTSDPSTLDVRLDFTRLYSPASSGGFDVFRRAGSFGETCLGCHTLNYPTTNGGGGGGLRLESESVAYSELLNEAISEACVSATRRVVAENPDGSLLYKQVTGTSCGPRMGLNGDGYGNLSTTEIALIRYWIEKGALQ